MDFGQLLHTAQKNEKTTKNGVRCYSTKFEPPKKEKKAKELSVNIKKFLEKKEAEEKRKAEEARKKKEELLALRAQDKKATRRVNVMLKRTKSANQSVIEDAVDNDNTAVTLAGPMQPDEDDYGYVSQEASAYYNKMMERYSKMPEEPKFDLTKKKVSTNLLSTKDRVKAALEKEKEEAMHPHRRKRKHKDKEHKDEDEDEEGISYGAPDRDVRPSSPSSSSASAMGPPPPKPKPKPRPAPPIMNFADLLKIAEKKQFEPIVIEKKEKEEERLLTKKQRKEIYMEKESLQRRESRREAERRAPPPADKVPGSGRIPKIGEKFAKPASKDRSDGNDKISKLDGHKLFKPNMDDRIPKPSGSHPSAKPIISKPPSSTITNATAKLASSSTDRNERLTNSTKSSINSVPPTKPMKNPMPSSSNVKPSRNQENVRQTLSNVNSFKDKPKSLSSSLNGKPKELPPKDLNSKKFLPGDLRYKKPLPNDIPAKKMPPPDSRARKFPPNDLKPKQFPPRDLKPKQFPPPDVRRKEFPPSDVRRKEFPPRDVKKPVIGSKRPILDDDSEYDSEMDDFIDDDEQEGDYSKYISEIFGYDKSKYRDVDDDVDNMESTFAQQMKEEVISTKIGIMEDLEDMKQEEEEKKRKALMKKRRKL